MGEKHILHILQNMEFLGTKANYESDLFATNNLNYEKYYWTGSCTKTEQKYSDS